MKPVREYLLDMLEYIGYLETFAAEGKAALKQDIKTRLAVQKAYEVIGEIVKRLPDVLLNQQADLPWRQIKGFRDVLIHQYDAIDLDLVWDALEDLRAAAQALLDSLPAEDERDAE